MTTSRRTRDYGGGSKSGGDGKGECRAPPSWDLVATALVLAAEAMPRSLQTTPMVATAVSPSCIVPSSAARLSRRGVG